MRVSHPIGCHGIGQLRNIGNSDLRMIRGYEHLLRRMPVVKQVIAQDSPEALEELYKNVRTFKALTLARTLSWQSESPVTSWL